MAITKCWWVHILVALFFQYSYTFTALSLTSTNLFKRNLYKNLPRLPLNTSKYYLGYLPNGFTYECGNFERTTKKTGTYPYQRLKKFQNASLTSPNAPQVQESEHVNLPKSQIDNSFPKTTFVGECSLPTKTNKITVRSYKHVNESGLIEVLALFTDKLPTEGVLLRVHDQCLTSEVFGSQRCDCKEQLDIALCMLQEKNGLLIYLLQEGRGIGLANKIAAYGLQDSGFDTVDANRHLGFMDDIRSYDSVPFILKDLGVKSAQLVTNNPTKVKKLEELGLALHEIIPLRVKPNEHNEKYLRTKQDRMSHLLNIDNSTTSPTEQSNEV